MNKNGFTLLELLIVITIIGVLAAIATTNFGSWTLKANIEAQIREMYGDLMNAQIRAMSTNRIHFVDFSGTQYTITDDLDGDGTKDSPPADTVIVQRTMKNQITWAGKTGASLYFDSRGIANNLDTNNVGTVSLANNSGAVFDCIIITPTRINMGLMNGGACVQR
ncbi:MAG TPA: GspH/FimT family pseudopilin [Dissulfurispiraceae bacterium]